MKCSLLLLCLACVVYLATAASYYRGEPADLQTAASGHGHYGRVQIKVYRGQSKGGDGHHHHGHAPYGYWVRQPPDHHGHGHH
ncbi:unnamed protein product [Orchesella dallaii]|uniref:Uncharacterized protein n=1 Tax=Orchesella dallaii TaxID=48710 RepID=A0ABP1PKF3_9HEXA